MFGLKVKICCIGSLDEAHLAIEAGAWALGLVAEMPSGVGPISDQRIANIARSVPSSIKTFLLTSRVQADAIIDHHNFCGTTAIQLVDHVAHDELRKLRQALPGISLVQVIHVIDEQSIAEAVAVSGLVDMILLDSGNPALKVKELGGTGRTHDWRLSRTIRERVKLPLFLAGGLNAGNVSDAIMAVQPYGVDLCSGIRNQGRLDAAGLSAFFDAVTNAQPTA